MTITHHPDYATLMSYAAGSLPEALSAVVAAHVSNCPACRRELALMDGLGGALLSNVVADTRVAAIDPAQLAARAPARRQGDSDEAGADADVPVPLRRLVGPRLDDIHWRRLGYGIWHYPLPLSREANGDLRLLKISPGLAMPEHGHGGMELTLVLRGAYSDETGTYRSGDLADLDEDVEHRPITDVEAGCICLIASERRARFKTMFGRLMQPIVGL